MRLPRDLASVTAIMHKQREALEKLLIQIISVQEYMNVLWEMMELMKENSEKILKETDHGESE